MGVARTGLRQGDSSKPPQAVAWHLFDEEATTQIRHVCRNFEVTVNSFLLKHLTKAIRPHLEDQSAAVPWMIPVNLRGKVKQERETANYTSYIRIEVQSYETVHDIHRNIYAALCKGDHWANWQAYQLGRFLSCRHAEIPCFHANWPHRNGILADFRTWATGILARKSPSLDARGAGSFARRYCDVQLVGVGCYHIPKPPEPDSSNPSGRYHGPESSPNVDTELGQGNRNRRGEYFETPDGCAGLGLDS